MEREDQIRSWGCFLLLSGAWKACRGGSDWERDREWGEKAAMVRAKCAWSSSGPFMLMMIWGVIAKSDGS